MGQRRTKVEVLNEKISKVDSKIAAYTEKIAAAIVTVSSFSFAICLCTTPVLSRIHASLVSTILARSLLSHTLSGTQEPVPHILPVIFFSMISVLHQPVKDLIR